MQNYQVGKEPDYLQMNVFTRTSKGNIIYTRQNKKTLVYGHFWRLLNFEPFWDIKIYFLDFLKDSCFTFFIQKVYKKKFANLSTSWHIEEVTAKTILIF